MFRILSVVFISVFSLSLVFSSFGAARELRDVKMPDELTAAGKKLILNGMGLREFPVMGIDIKVYIGGLYLEKPATDGMAIVNSNEVKYFKMHFLRHVSSYDQVKTWREGVEKTCDASCDEVKEQSKKFKDILPAVNEGDEINYTFDPKGVTLDLNGKPLGTLTSLPLARAMLLTWLGPRAGSADLKRALLEGSGSGTAPGSKK